MNARLLCLQALTDITDRGAYANLRLKSLPDALDERERRWIVALTYTTLDHLLTVDYYLSHYVKGSVKPVIRGILRIGVSELLYFGTPAHAAISEAVSLTRAVHKPALSGFVNAVLRSIDRERESLPPLPEEPVSRLSVQYSYPDWLVREWCDSYGAEFTERMLSPAFQKMQVRAQYPETTEALIAELAVPVSRGKLDDRCLIPERGLDVAATPAFVEGRMTVQSESAMLVCRALGDCRGKRVLDACAAPGGKSAYIASLCENNVQLTCMELHEHRKALLDSTLTRLHVRAETLLRDATEPVPAFIDAFDAVLLDAPCSGLGLTLDKPDVRYGKHDADIAALAALQQTLLCQCASYVRPNGVLVYATCTISRRENEENIARFLETRADFALDPLPLPLANTGMLQLFPHVHGTDGFFIARLLRCI